MRIGQLCIIKRLSVKNTVTNHQLYYFYKICLILPTNFIPNWFNCLQSQAKKKVFPPGTKWTSLESLNLHFKGLFFFLFLFAIFIKAQASEFHFNQIQCKKCFKEICSSWKNTEQTILFLIPANVASPGTKSINLLLLAKHIYKQEASVMWEGITRT